MSARGRASEPGAAGGGGSHPEQPAERLGGVRDILAEAIADAKREARAHGLADAEIDAELAAWRAERRADRSLSVRESAAPTVETQVKARSTPSAIMAACRSANRHFTRTFARRRCAITPLAPGPSAPAGPDSAQELAHHPACGSVLRCRPITGHKLRAQ